MSDSIQIPWMWYVVRASALVAFFLLYLSIFLGVIGRIPGLKKMSAKFGALNIHGWISLQALIFVFIHATSLLLDKYMNFTWQEVFVPMKSGLKPELVTLGILGLYLMIILVATSYARRILSQKVWRFVHFSNIVLYILVIIHALYLGTDLKTGISRDVFICANAFLAILFALNIFFRIKGSRKLIDNVQIDANLSQSNPPRGQKRNNQNFRRRI